MKLVALSANFLMDGRMDVDPSLKVFLIIFLIKSSLLVFGMSYTPKSVVSHFVATKVHVILQSFVVLTWLSDTIELL